MGPAIVFIMATFPPKTEIARARERALFLALLLIVKAMASSLSTCVSLHHSVVPASRIKRKVPIGARIFTIKPGSSSIIFPSSTNMIKQSSVNPIPDKSFERVVKL